MAELPNNSGVRRVVQDRLNVLTGTQLGQVRPTTTTPVVIVTSGENEVIKANDLIICNTTRSALHARIFHDKDGDTYDESTALAWDWVIPNNRSIPYPYPIDLDDPDGNLAVASSTIEDGGNSPGQNTSGLTFTVYGETYIR